MSRSLPSAVWSRFSRFLCNDECIHPCVSHVSFRYKIHSQTHLSVSLHLVLVILLVLLIFCACCLCRTYLIIFLPLSFSSPNLKLVSVVYNIILSYHFPRANACVYGHAPKYESAIGLQPLHSRATTSSRSLTFLYKCK
jgi:hypothetical protein